MIFVPKERKCKIFTGGSSAVFYEWLDDINAVLNFRPYEGTDKAVCIYEHLGGEARQEIRYRPQVDRKDPQRILDILKEIYERPQSLTRLQRQFFDRRQRQGESIREYSHALLAIMEEIKYCPVEQTWCNNSTLRDQFAENVSDVALRRELSKTIRHQPNIFFFYIRKEAT